MLITSAIFAASATARPVVKWSEDWKLQNVAVAKERPRSELNYVAVKYDEQGRTLAAIGLTVFERDWQRPAARTANRVDCTSGGEYIPCEGILDVV